MNIWHLCDNFFGEYPYNVDHITQCWMCLLHVPLTPIMVRCYMARQQQYNFRISIANDDVDVNGSDLKKTD